jgi:transposase-like protein
VHLCTGTQSQTAAIALSHKHRNLLVHAPERLHDEISADYKDMIYAARREEIETRRKAFIRKWRLKHRAVADSLEEAADRAPSGTRRPAIAADECEVTAIKSLARCNKTHPNRVDTVRWPSGAGRCDWLAPTGGQI